MGTLSKGIEYLGYQEGHEKGVEEGIERGRQEGIQQGLDQGIEQGTVTTYVKTIKSLLKAGNTIEQAVKILELDEETKEKVLNELNKQQ